MSHSAILVGVKRASRMCASATVLGLLLAPSAARADDKQECLTASDQGQQLRDDGKYRQAREAFSRCSRETCPALVKRDCVRWLADLETATPTVVISAKDNKGNDLVDVQVTVDGVPLTSKLDGKPTAVDPGEHVFHGETAGFPAVEEHVVVHAAEKSRILTMQFGTSAAPVAPAASTATSSSEGAPSSRGGPPVGAWVLAGVAVAAFGTEAGFGLTGIGQRNTDLAQGGCAPTCSDSEKSSIQTKFLIADIALGVGVVSAALAAYFFLSSHGSGGAARIDLGGLHF